MLARRRQGPRRYFRVQDALTDPTPNAFIWSEDACRGRTQHTVWARPQVSRSKHHTRLAIFYQATNTLDRFSIEQTMRPTFITLAEDIRAPCISFCALRKRLPRSGFPYRTAPRQGLASISSTDTCLPSVVMLKTRTQREGKVD